MYLCMMIDGIPMCSAPIDEVRDLISGIYYLLGVYLFSSFLHIYRYV